MSFVKNQATDYIDMLDKLMKIATSVPVASAVVNAGGTGYVVGDLLTVAGGTFHFAAIIQVLTVGGSGEVLTVRMSQGGAYTANPTLTGNAVTGGTGSGATMDLTMGSAQWTLLRRSVQAASAVVNNGGSGGTNGSQTVTVVGGVGVTTATQFNVTITGGAITSVNSVITPGLYEAPVGIAPPGLTSTVQVTGAGLSGATLDVTWAYPTAQEQVMILEGADPGQPLIGFRTYNTPAVNPLDGTCRNWSLTGFTGYNASLTFTNQPGRSTGDSLTLGTGGAYFPLRDFDASYPIDFWCSVTDRRIVLVCKVRNISIVHFSSLYMGFLNQHGTDQEFPYPIYISGCTSRFNSFFADTTIARMSSICEMIRRNGSEGPGFLLLSTGVWQPVRNSSGVDTASPTRTQSQQFVVWPQGQITPPASPAEDLTTSAGGVDWEEVSPANGVPGTETIRLYPTPGTVEKRRRYPCTVIGNVSPDLDIYGELEGVFWVSAAGATQLTEEDTVTDNDQPYRVFPSGNRKLVYSYWCLRED